MAGKSTLSWLNPLFSPNGTHLLWNSTTNCVTDVKRAIVKANLLTETYSLQYNKAVFNQTRNTSRNLCHSEEENIPHFLIDCSTFRNDRKGLLRQTLSNIPFVYQEHPTRNWTSSELPQLLLDPSHSKGKPKNPTPDEMPPQFRKTLTNSYLQA